MTTHGANRGDTPPVDPWSEASDAPQIPEVTLLGEIARGGMGIVYRGRQEFLDRDVAVKLLAPHLQGKQFAERFRREARILAGIKHPHIVACHAAGTASNGQSYLVMEFVDGPNLRSWIADHGPVALPSALRLTRQLASALGHACDLGVIHRDVKPENILLEAPTSTAIDLAFPFAPKLVDLGLARMAQERGDLALTAPGAVMGTPATMAPEQFDAPDSVDFRADIYGLGCVLYQMLTGAAAFASTKLSDIVVEKRQRLGPDPCQRLAAIPPAVGQLVASMLACAPADRPADYRTLVAKLDELAASAVATPPAAAAKATAATAPTGPDLLRTAEFEFLAAGGAIGGGSGSRGSAFPEPTGQFARSDVPARAAASSHPAARRSPRAAVLAAAAVALAIAAVPALRLLPKEPPPTPPSAAPVAVAPRAAAIAIGGELRADAPVAVRADAAADDGQPRTYRWSVLPDARARIASPASAATDVRFDGLPGDVFTLQVEIDGATGAPMQLHREIALDYRPLDLFADLLDRDSAWLGRMRPRGEWHRDADGAVSCLADDMPSLRSRPIDGTTWRVGGTLRPERGRRGFAQVAVSLRFGSPNQLAIVCTREGASGERWSVSLLEIDRDDGRLGLSFRPLQQPKQVVAIDERGTLAGASWSITRRGSDLTFDFGFAGGGESEEHYERVRPDLDGMLLGLFARGGRGVFPTLELW